MSQAQIRFENVWKAYPLGGRKVSVGGVVRSFLGREHSEGIWAVQDVSFAVPRGEFLGIIGKNGAGKTTSLRMLAGISKQTRGTVETHGRVAPLIALGAGFHRELTGRENIFLNGAILGLTRREIQARFDEIVEFSGIAEALDAPLKQYSSGMMARLGFSVATHVDPDVLLVDEILSVGDAAFRQRSYQRMLSYRDRGCAVVFVSHDIAAVSVLCDRVLWMDKGRPKMMGPADEVVRAYLESCDRDQLNEPIQGQLGETGAVEVERVTFHDAQGRECQDFDYAAPLTIRLHYRARHAVEQPLFTATVLGQKGPLFSANMVIDGQAPQRIAAGRGWIEARFDALPLRAGAYRVAVTVKTNIHNDAFSGRIMGSFMVRSDARKQGFGHPAAAAITRINTLVHVPYEWKLSPAAEQSAHQSRPSAGWVATP